MKLWKSFHRQKMGVRPHQIIFEKENTENTYITWEDKMKPRIDVDDGIERWPPAGRRCCPWLKRSSGETT